MLAKEPAAPYGTGVDPFMSSESRPRTDLLLELFALPPSLRKAKLQHLRDSDRRLPWQIYAEGQVQMEKQSGACAPHDKLCTAPVSGSRKQVMTSKPNSRIWLEAVGATVRLLCL
jgi:hypothetical protein